MNDDHVRDWNERLTCRTEVARLLEIESSSTLGYFIWPDTLPLARGFRLVLVSI